MKIWLAKCCLKIPLKMSYRSLITFILILCKSGFCFSQENNSVEIKSNIIQDNFRGLGFHLIGKPINDQELWNTRYGKILKDINRDGYLRTFYQLTSFAPQEDKETPNSNEMIELKKVLRFLKDQNIKVYLTGRYHSMPESIKPSDGKILRDTVAMKKWAALSARFLEHLITEEGLTNVVEWNMTHELEGQGGENFDVGGNCINMELYEKHYRYAYKAIKSKGLNDLKFVNTDALGNVSSVRGTINYAVVFMNEVTDVYGAHSYLHKGAYWLKVPNSANWWQMVQYPDEMGDEVWNSPDRYKYSYNLFNYYTAHLTGGLGKPFTLGEIGGRKDNYDFPGGRYEQNKDRDNPEYGIFLAERVMAALNSGVASIAKWAFDDAHQVYNDNKTYYNRWGSITDKLENYRIRSEHYAYSLLTRYICSGAKVFETYTGDPLIRSLAVYNSDQTLTLALVNRGTSTSNITFKLNNSNIKVVKKFVYDPLNIPNMIAGDMQKSEKTISVKNGVFTDNVKEGVFVIYTSDVDETEPAAVTGVTVSKNNNGNLISWQENTETDIAYYRIYRGDSPEFVTKLNNQINSTIGTTYLDTATNLLGNVFYKIKAVDRHGNESNSVITSTQEYEYLQSLINISPNPASQTFSLKIINRVNFGKLDLELVSPLGEILIEKKSLTNFEEFDISGLEKGVYIVRIFIDETMVSRKLVVYR